MLDAIKSGLAALLAVLMLGFGLSSCASSPVPAPSNSTTQVETPEQDEPVVGPAGRRGQYGLEFTIQPNGDVVYANGVDNMVRLKASNPMYLEANRALILHGYGYRTAFAQVPHVYQYAEGTNCYVQYVSEGKADCSYSFADDTDTSYTPDLCILYLDFEGDTLDPYENFWLIDMDTEARLLENPTRDQLYELYRAGTAPCEGLW